MGSEKENGIPFANPTEYASFIQFKANAQYSLLFFNSLTLQPKIEHGPDRVTLHSNFSQINCSMFSYISVFNPPERQTETMSWSSLLFDLFEIEPNLICLFAV